MSDKTQITLDVTKTSHQNAVEYFDKAKKASAKLETIESVLARTEKKLAQLEAKANLQESSEDEDNFVNRKIAWYEKFRWMFTTSGLLAVGGRDANSNEVVIKKHVDAHDIVFHTEMPGSPFFVLKTDGADIATSDPMALEEVGQIVAAYSKAWKEGYSSTTVFWVTPDQVSKEAQAGESMGKGSFMIRGKKHFLQPKVEISIGLRDDGVVVCGTARSVKSQVSSSAKMARIVQGREKSSNLAKLLRKQFGGGDLDEYIRVLPAGGGRITK